MNEQKETPVRDRLLTVFLSDEEMKSVKKEAEKLGMPVTALIRLLIKNFADGITFAKDEKK